MNTRRSTMDPARWAILLTHPVLIAVVFVGLSPWLIVVEFLVNAMVVFSTPSQPGYPGEVPTDREEPLGLQVGVEGFEASLPQIDSAPSLVRRIYIGLYAPTITFGVVTALAVAMTPSRDSMLLLAVGLAVVTSSLYLGGQAVVLLCFAIAKGVLASVRPPLIPVGLQGRVLSFGDDRLELTGETTTVLDAPRGAVMVRNGGGELELRGPVRQLLWISDAVEALETRGSAQYMPSAMKQLHAAAVSADRG